ncbi:MAG: EAL domain-containing protein [Clostridiaceae bacterium]|nr:EAL domain-containing protein [Clostridiaceae bacterium]
MQIKILIVDDSASDRLIIQKLLSEYSLLTASDGLEAMQIINENDDINLLILDLNMPNMDGFEVLTKLRDNIRYKNIRTIILTNYNELDNEIRGLKLGAVDYIRKPIHMESLKVRIDVHVALLRAEYNLRQRLSMQGITFEQVFNQAPVGIAISVNNDEEASPIESEYKLNPMFEQIIGRTTEELRQTGMKSITHPDDLKEELNLIKKMQTGEICAYTIEKRFIKPDGSVIWVHSIMSTLTFPDEHKSNHIYIIRDITERKEMEKALKESERSKSVLLAHLPGLAYRCYVDRQWTMQFVSEGCRKLTGYAPESLLYNKELSFNDVIAPEYRDALWEEWERILPRRLPFKYEYEIITASGERKWVLEMGEGVYSESGEAIAVEGIIIDISDRKEIENLLKYNNEYDRLTGLHNLNYLQNIILEDAQKINPSKRAIIGITLISMHELSTMFGFQYTQNLIKDLARLLEVHSTENRLLGNAYENRFIYYIRDYNDKNELLDFCKNISGTLEPFLAAERISAAIGIVEITRDNERDVDEIFRKLLIASQKARQSSDSTESIAVCFYDEEIEKQVTRENEIKCELSQIASSDDSEGLFLQFQPILYLNSNKLWGFEALARMESKILGRVSPMEFIPIAEETKLIVPLGKKLIQQAFRFLKKLEKQGYDQLKVSINLSVIQLLKTEFLNEMLEIARKMDVDPAKIAIEVTESVFSSECDKINRALENLKKAGLQIFIDDFGTGYSSLARIRDFNVDTIKIDKSFIDKLTNVEPEKTITCDIISMAHKLGYTVVAEGVEYEKQKEYLLNSGCDKIQGYLISRPLDENAAIDFLGEYLK